MGLPWRQEHHVSAGVRRDPGGGGGRRSDRLLERLFVDQLRRGFGAEKQRRHDGAARGEHHGCPGHDAGRRIRGRRPGICWDSSTSQWAAINLNLEAGDSEVSFLQSSLWSDRLFFGTQNGKIAYWDGTDCHSSSTTAVSTARASSSALFEDDLLVAGENGKIASLDVTRWKNADGTGSGTGVYNDGAPVNNDEVVSIVAKGDKIFLVTREKMLATGDVLVGTWYKCDGTTSSLIYSGRDIPHQLIGFFASSPGAEWRICNGSAATPNLNTTSPKGMHRRESPRGATLMITEPTQAIPGLPVPREQQGPVRILLEKPVPGTTWRTTLIPWLTHTPRCPTFRCTTTWLLLRATMPP